MMTDVDGCPINPGAVVIGQAFKNQDDTPLPILKQKILQKK